MENSTSLTAKVYHELKSEIVRLRLAPGETLIVQQLAEKMNISRTPVKEALTMLAKDHFVERTSGNKFRVTDISISSIIDLFELRKLFECFAIRETINSCTAEDIAFLEKNVADYSAALKANDHSKFFELDCQFHQFFIRKLNNEILCQFSSQLTDKLQRTRFITVHLENRQTLSIGEHARIINAIKEKDSDKAQEELRLHLDNVISDIKDRIAGNQDFLLFSNVII